MWAEECSLVPARASLLAHDRAGGTCDASCPPCAQEAVVCYLVLTLGTVKIISRVHFNPVLSFSLEKMRDTPLQKKKHRKKLFSHGLFIITKVNVEQMRCSLLRKVQL